MTVRLRLYIPSGLAHGRSMEDQCDPAEVKRHFDLLLKEVQQISAKKAMALEGKVMEVLAEEQNTQDGSYFFKMMRSSSVIISNESLIWMSMTLLNSIGRTIRPNSSTFLTIPVDFNF